MTNSMYFRRAIALAVCCFFGASLWAQGGLKGGGGATNPIGSTSTNVPGGLPGRTTTGPTNTSTFPEMQRPVFLSGRVVTNDGTPPPTAATMQLVCSGSPKNIGVTDSKGRFNVDLTNRVMRSVYADASESNPGGFGSGMPSSAGSTRGGNSAYGDRGFAGCELLAMLPGYRSDRVNLINHRTMDNPDVGTIVLTRLANVEGTTISVTSALAPKDAKKAFEKGLNEEKKQKWENAERDFQKAVDIYPKYATACYELGVSEQQQGNVDGARKAFEQALAADAKLVGPYQQLTDLAAKDEKWDDVLKWSAPLLKLDPVDFPMEWFNNGLANYRLKNLDAADKALRKGIEVDSLKTVPEMHHLLGVVLVGKKEYAAAGEEWRTFLRLAPNSPDAERVKRDLAEMEKTVGPAAENKTP